MHHVTEGQGPVVVLSHALGCSLRMWDEVAARLRERWTVVRYDQPGHGASPAAGRSIEDYADAAASLLRSFGPVHFVGLSMGGMVAQALAVRHPDIVRSLVIANSAAHYDASARAMWQARIQTVQAQGMAAIAEGALQRWFTPAFHQGDRVERLAAMRAELVAIDPEAYARSCEAVAAIDFRASNARIEAPALVIARQPRRGNAARHVGGGLRRDHRRWIGQSSSRAPECRGAAGGVCRGFGSVLAQACPGRVKPFGAPSGPRMNMVLQLHD